MKQRNPFNHGEHGVHGETQKALVLECFHLLGVLVQLHKQVILPRVPRGLKAGLRMKRLVMILVCALPFAVQAQTLGRLFHTPEQRALLDLARKSTPLNAVGEPAAPAASTVQEGLSVSGIVSRSDGKRSTWVNGRLEHDGENIGKQDRTQVWVKLPGGEVKLKVGQSLDPATGQVAEGFRRPPPPEPPAAKPAPTPTPAKRDDNADSDQAAAQ